MRKSISLSLLSGLVLFSWLLFRTPVENNVPAYSEDAPATPAAQKEGHEHIEADAVSTVAVNDLAESAQEAAEERSELSRRTAEDLVPAFHQDLRRQREAMPLAVHRHRDDVGGLPNHPGWPDSRTLSVSYSLPDADGLVRRVKLVEPGDLPYTVRVEEILHLHPRDIPQFREMADGVTPRHIEAMAEEVADLMMIRLSEGVSDAMLREVLEPLGAESVRVLSHRLNAHRIRLPEVTPDGVPEAVWILAEIGAETASLQTVETDPIVRALDILEPNDPRFVSGELWGMNNIKGPEGWAIQNTADDVIIGVLDTGVNYNHPDLQANMWVNPNPGTYPGITGDVHGINAIKMTGSPMDDHGHGTHVAGTIAAVGNNNTGVVGVAWRAQIMGLRFLSAQGGTIGDAITSLDYALEMGAHLTNNSWGGGPFNQTLFELIQEARDADQLFIAAAGNSSNNNDVSPIYPATYPVDNVIAVSAINSVENLASFSTFGPSTVLLGAPGVNVMSTIHESPWYQAFSGTSMAAPHVTGAAALLLQHHNFETYDVIKARLTESARQIPGLQGRVITEGTLDLPGALNVEEDGNMRVRVTVRGDGNNPIVFEGDEALLTVSLTDLLPVTDATISATASPAGPDGASITFVADSNAPGNYTATYTLPIFPESVSERIMEIDFTITAPEKNTFTDTVAVEIQSRPANRFLATALELDSVNPGSVTINNTFAEKESGERNRIAFLRFHRSLWYTWTPDSVASVEINTLGSLTSAGNPMDTVLAVYTSPVPNPTMADLVEVVVNGDISSNNFLSRVTFDVLEPGTTYFIQVGDTFRPGDLQLNVIPVFGPPIVTQEPPASVTVFEGLPLRINAFLAGADSFQWHKDGQPLSEGGRYAGTQTPSLLIDPAIPSDAGSYTLAGTNQNGTATTSPATVTVQTPTGLSSWNRLEPGPTGNDLASVVRGSGATVAVGGQGTLLVRDDAAGEWERVSTGTRARLNDVIYDPDAGYVAVGDQGTILRSSDGSSWTTADSGTGLALRAVASSGNRYIAVGGDHLQGMILESPDGVTWTDRTPAGLEHILYGVIWDGGRFVAVGGHWRTDTGIALSSVDGVFWSNHALNDQPSLHAIARNGNTLVAVGGDWIDPVILRNTGNFTWSAISFPGEETLYSVAFGNSLWLATGERGALLSSADGTDWTLLSSGTDFALRGAVWDGGNFILVGDGGVILDSADGVNWAPQFGGTRTSLEDVIGGPGGFLAVGEGGHVRFSADGQSWQDREPSSAGRLLGAAANASLFVQVGQGGEILSSTNGGQSWTERMRVPHRSFEAVAFGNLFVAVGEGGIIYTSSNGTAWQERSSPTQSRLRAVAYNGSSWRAVGQDGTILQSTNGTTWSLVSGGPATTLRGVTHNGLFWIAVGDGGRIYASTDGLAWTNVPSPTTRTLNAVASSGGTVFAVGNRGTLLTSADGLVWESRDSRVSANLLGATMEEGLLIAVGGMGTVLSTVALDQVATPDISPDSVGNENSVTVTLSTATEGAEIFFTLDGSDPNPSSTRYTGPFTLNNPATVRARAFKDGMESSAVAERTYFLQGAPFILQPAEDLAMAVGGSGELNPQVSGEQPLSFQWERAADPVGPWTDLVGADARVLSFTNAQSADAGFYRLRISNAFDELVSAPVQVWVWEVPAIITQPVDLMVASGSPASFTVEASGGGPLSYQWFKDGAPIPGATSASYTLTAASLSAAGSYSVVVSSPVGTVTSDSATLTVGIPPRILTQPVSVTQAAGETAMFSVRVSGSEPLTVNWQFRAVGADEFVSLGVNTTTLTRSNLSTAEAGEYRVSVSNTFGSRLSDAAVLTVLEAPVITAQPADTSIILNQSGALTVSVSGAEPLAYQWLKNGNMVPGATAATLDFASVQASDGATYSVLVSNEVGAVQSASATLTVLFPAQIITQPADRFVVTGGTGTFSVTATGTNLTYQWQENVEGTWQDLPGQNAGTFTVSSVSKEEDDGRVFRVIADNAYGEAVISSPATLHVQEAPAIVVNPQSQGIVLGQPVTFSVEATGGEPLSYQWRRNGSNISGATSSTFTISSVTANRNGDVYTVRVTNPVGQVTSSGATLTVLFPPSILNQPQSQTAAEGGTVTFSVLAAGNPTLLYQWRRDGEDLEGETAATLTLSGVSSADAGAYSVRVTNAYGEVVSNEAVLTVLESLDFVHAIRITFDGYTESEVLTNFPVPVKFNNSIIGFDYDDFISSAGDDLRFWTSDLEPLVYEIEQWDTEGDSYVWVRIPELSQGTFIFASWGDADAAPMPHAPQYTWSEDFLAAWHLNENPANTPDSATLVANNSGFLNTSQTSANPSIVPGVIGSGFETRNGLTHRIQIDNHSHLAGRDQATFSFWYRRDINADRAAEIFAHDRSGINRRIGYYFVWQGHHDGIAFYPRVASGTIDSPDLFSGTLQVGDWHHVAITQDKFSSNRADFRMYINGVEVATALNRSLSSSDRWILEPNYLIGSSATNSAPDATLDEMRMASTVRSPAWIKAEYLSMVDPHTFGRYEPATVIPNTPIISLVTPTADTVRIPEGVGLLLEASVFEPVEESGALEYEWTALSGPGPVTFEASDALTTAAWFDGLGEYVLRLLVTNTDDPSLSAQRLISVTVTDEEIGGGEGPAEWTGYSLGVEGGAFTFDGETMFLEAQDTNGSLGGDTDIAYFVGVPVSGDGTLTARLTQNGSTPGISHIWSSQVGLMALNDPEELNTAKFASTLAQQRSTGLNDYETFTRRSPSEGGALRQLRTYQTGTGPVTLRIQRTGNTIQSFVQVSGVWQPLHSETMLAFSEVVYVGFYLTSWAANHTATFDQIDFDFDTGGGGDNIGPWVSAGEDVHAVPNENVTLSGEVEDDGLPNPPGEVTLAWTQIAGPETVSLSGADTLTPTFTASLGGEYRFRLTANDGEVTTLDEVTVTLSGSTPIAFTSEPILNAVVGQAYSYTVTFTGGDEETLTFTAPGLPEWLNLQPGSSGREWILSGNPTAADVGGYAIEFVASDENTQATQAFELTVWPEGTVPGMPVIEVQPVSASLTAGDVLTLSVQASGEGTLTYQWLHDGVEIEGAEGDTLTIDPVRVANARAYRVVVSNALGQVTSQTASVTVAPAGLTVRADDQSKFAGQSDPVLTWSIIDGALFGGDALSGSLEREPGEAVGVYAILQGTLAAGADYDLVFVPGTFTIEELFLQSLTFDANGGSGTAPDASDVIVGSTVSVPGAGDLTKEGFVFNGWRDTLGAVTYQEGDSFPMPSRDMILSAQWNVAVGELEVFQFNFGNQDYTGTNSPGHAAGLVPSASDQWTTVAGSWNLEFEPGQFMRTRRANAFTADAPVPLDGVTGNLARNSGTGMGVFATPLGESWANYTRTGTQDDRRGRSLGVWFEGLPHGEYIVFAVVHNPVLIAAGITTNVGIGVGSATSGNLAWNAANLTGTSFAASPQTNTWEEGVNYAKTTVTVDANNPILYVIQGGPQAPHNVFDYHTISSIQLVRQNQGPGEGFTVTYAANGGEGAVPEDLNQYAAEQNVAVMGQGTLFRECYVFAGWRDELSGMTYQPLDTFQMPERDVTLVAQWDDESAKTPFELWLQENDLQGGAGDEEQVTGLTLWDLFIMGASLDGDVWEGILVVESFEAVGHSGMELSFTAQPGRQYTLEHSSDLVSGDWQPLGEVQTHDSEQMGIRTFSVIPPGSGPQFFRIRVEILD
jgi:subtilisin family serine protease